jgi:hypothetical protein
LSLFRPSTRKIERPGLPPPGPLSGVVAPAGSPPGTEPEAPAREVPEILASNLLEALVEWIEVQPAIADRFPGGVYQQDSPPGAGSQLPSLTLSQESGKVLGLLNGATIQWPEVGIEVQAEYAGDARKLAEWARNMILSGPSLSWDGGSEAGRYEADGGGGELERGIGPNGGDVWAHRIPLVFITARG